MRPIGKNIILKVTDKPAFSDKFLDLHLGFHSYLIGEVVEIGGQCMNVSVGQIVSVRISDLFLMSKDTQEIYITSEDNILAVYEENKTV